MTRPLLLLLPGLLCDAASWAEPSASLAPHANCQVANYGQLDSIPAMAAQVLHNAAADRFSLAGHSMGGRVALEVLRQAPHWVERLALLDTGYQALAAGSTGEAERAGRQHLLALAQTKGMRAMGAQWARGMVHPSRIDSSVFEAILAMIERSSPERFEAQIRALLNRPEAGPLLPTIACDTLLLCGSDDLWSPLARHQQMQALIPEALLAVIAASGHMTPMERPQAVTQALRAWLARPATGRATASGH